MIPRTTPPVDSRDTTAVLAEFQERRPAYLPKWSPPDKTAGAALGQIFSRFMVAILQRLNQAPAKDKLALLDLLGLRLVPAQSARVPIVFQLSQGAPDSAAPAGTGVAAPPPPGSTQQVVFETEQDSGVAAAKLAEVISLWPGRDQFINHSAAFAAGQQITFFQNLQLQQTDHILYLAHSTLLAFAGKTHLEVEFDLVQESSSPLEITWEYWDGQVWRGFEDFKPSCLDPAEAGHDGTNGLAAPGSIRLDTEGAKTALTAVDGAQSYWIRGRLTQPLPPDPAELLPIVDTLRLRSLIDQSMELNVAASYADSFTTTAKVTDESGQPLEHVTVAISSSDDSSFSTPVILVHEDGTVASGLHLSPGSSYQFDVTYAPTPGQTLVMTGTTFAKYGLSAQTAEIDLIVKVEGLLPDKAVSLGKTVDVTKAFYPLGPNPAPGAAFYFKQNEIFNKPGAAVKLYVSPVSPIPAWDRNTTYTQGQFVLYQGQEFQCAVASTTSTPGANSDWKALPSIPHTINWEYWNGYEWKLMLQSDASPSKDFTAAEVISFTVPVDMVSTKVNNEDGLWIRVRLVSGAYAVQQSITLASGAQPPIVTFNQPQPPVVAAFRFGYTWEKGPVALDQVLTYNDFQYEDHTSDARWPGNSFSPFSPVTDQTPAVYFGFDKQLPINNFGIYMDILEQPGEAAGPALVWEYWNGGGWQTTVVEDGTRQLQLPGIISFIPAADAQSLARFDLPLYWLRGRLKEDGPPNQTVTNNIFTNAVWASQWQTFTNAPIGASNGAPNQIFQFTQIPVLPNQEIQVQELSGPRANTEWRTLATEVASGDPNVVSELEALLASEGTQTDISLGDLRLTRDKTKRVTGVFVTWQEQPNFFDSGPNDRHYVLDHASGRLFFGNGDTGLIPPAGSAIQATTFRSGGGLAGNVQAGTITQLLGSVSGVQSVKNPRAAEGGADGETLEAFSLRAPLSIRTRGRAIMPGDYEAMAHEASAGVAVARAIPLTGPSGPARPGWVTILIIPQSQDPRPVPSFGLREEVRTYLEQRAPAEIAAAHHIQVIGPTYLPVDVTATLAPQDPTQAGTVEQDAQHALATFLHPLYGGPDGLGWDLGRGVFASDIAGVLGNVNGVDYVSELAMSVNGVLQGEHVQVPAGQIVVAGLLKLSLVLPAS
jgi:uncharacterized phage protein gp47/JayE